MSDSNVTNNVSKYIMSYHKKNNILHKRKGLQSFDNIQLLVLIISTQFILLISINHPYFVVADGFFGRRQSGLKFICLEIKHDQVPFQTSEENVIKRE